VTEGFRPEFKESSVTDLNADRFRGNPELKLMLAGARMTTNGFDADGDLIVDRPNNPVAVAAIQQALRDLDYELEVTGAYDEFTAAQVRQFKHDQSLTTPGAITDDGVAGPGTMRRLDELFSRTPGPPPEPVPDDRHTGDGDFRIKLMEGVSAELGAGLFQYTFVVWDPARSQAGVFNYEGVIAGAGVGNPFAGESDWVDFTLDPTIHVDFLSGQASHRKTTAAVERFTLDVTPEHAPSFTVQFDGLTLGVGLETGTGTFTLDSAGVRPFDG
jgi:peptidoglycan hydrolase-like protein with peptidoglycan-binding domain